MENPLEMEVSSWENHLFLWAMFHSYVKLPEGTLQFQLIWPPGHAGMLPYIEPVRLKMLTAVSLNFAEVVTRDPVQV